MAKPIRYLVDPGGELIVRVGAQHPNTTMECRVSAAVIGRTSAIWRGMLPEELSKPQAPQASDVPWVLDLPQDDPTPMAVLFSIAHGRLEAVPEYPTIRAMYDIILHSNKYKLVGLLGPWVSQWMYTVTRVLGGPPDESLMAMWIAFELGSK